jgi:hypothetical protein
MSVTEADEAARDKHEALQNLREQVLKSEAEGVVAMYERAAWNEGATADETEQVIVEALVDLAVAAKTKN